MLEVTHDVGLHQRQHAVELHACADPRATITTSSIPEVWNPHCNTSYVGVGSKAAASTSASAACVAAVVARIHLTLSVPGRKLKQTAFGEVICSLD